MPIGQARKLVWHLHGSRLKSGTCCPGRDSLSGHLWSWYSRRRPTLKCFNGIGLGPSGQTRTGRRKVWWGAVATSQQMMSPISTAPPPHPPPRGRFCLFVCFVLLFLLAFLLFVFLVCFSFPFYSCWLCHCYVSLLACLFLLFLLAFLFLFFLADVWPWVCQPIALLLLDLLWS